MGPLSRCRLAVDGEQLRKHGWWSKLLGRLSHPPLVAKEVQVKCSSIWAPTEMRRSPPFPSMHAIQKQVFCPLRFQWHSPDDSRWRGTSHGPPFRRRPGSDWPARVQHLSGLFCRELCPELGRGKPNRSPETTTLSPRMAIWVETERNPSPEAGGSPVQDRTLGKEARKLLPRLVRCPTCEVHPDHSSEIQMLLDAGSPARFTLR